MKWPSISQFQGKYLSLLRRLRISDQTFLLVLAVIVGGVVGAGAILYAKLLELSHSFFWEILPGWVNGNGAMVIITPCLGALCLWPFLRLFPRATSEDGVPAAMQAVAMNNGRMPWLHSFRCMVMSAFTLGSGGSAGSEGPIILIGSALASGVGQLLRVSGERLRVIAACGAAAGLASVFNAPIAGVLFSLEVVMGEFNVHSFSPIVISSVVSTAVSRAFMPRGMMLGNLPYTLFSPWEIVFYAVMGALAGLVSVAFIRTMQSMTGFFDRRVTVPQAFRPAVGALFVGILGYFYPQVFGFSYAPITAAISGQFVFTTLLILLALKIVCTTLTLGSGGSGGILYPSLFLGAMLGTACGMFFQHFFPHIVGLPGGYGIVGMGAVLGAVVQAPMTAIIMIFELTNAYRVILPMMTACIMASLVQKSILSGSIYTLSLARRGIDIEAGREMGILTSLKVGDVMEREVATIPSDTSFESIVNQCITGACNYLYIIDDRRNLEGVVSFSDVKEFVYDEDLKGLVIAKDLSSPDLIYATPDETLASAMNKFSFIDMEQLPVVEPVNGTLRITGVITRSRLLNAYRQQMLRRTLINHGT